jgi:hypothetical protein
MHFKKINTGFSTIIKTPSLLFSRTNEPCTKEEVNGSH